VFPEKVQKNLGKKTVVETIQQNEKLFRQEADVAQRVGVWEWEVATGKAAWVHRADTLLATKPENVNTYEAFINRIHPEDRKIVMEAIACSFATESEYDIKFRLGWDDGSVRWLRGKGNFLQDNTDKAPRMISKIIDITKRQQTEQALLLTQQRLQHILRSSPAIIYSCKATGDRRFTFFSENITDILGYEMSECLDDSRFWIERIHPEDLQRLFSTVSKLFDNGHDIQEYRFRHKDGNYLWIRDQAKVVKDDFGNPIEIVGFWVNISDRKQAELQRQGTQNALQQSEVKFRELAQREALLNRLSSQIRASLDINSILQTAVTEILNLLQIDSCTFIWSYKDAETPYWEIVQEARSPALPSLVGLQLTHAEVRSISQKVSNKEIFQVDNVQNLPESALREMLLSFGCTAALTLPIHSQSGEIGLLCCTSFSGERPWRDREVELLLAVADQLAIAIDQAKLYKQSHTAAQTAQDKAQQLEKALRELSSTQAQLIQTEKMSSLGQLVAGVAHEINNPVGFIYGNLTHASEYTQHLLRLIELYQQQSTQLVPEIQKEIQAIDLDFLKEDLPKLLHSMMIGAERISQIVLSLRNFSRFDEADMKPVDIHEGIDNTLLLLQNRLKKVPKQPQIQIIKEYGNLPQVECYAGQLNQVFMNLLTNAIDVLEECLVNSPEQITNPQICIRTEILNDEQVFICITDNGPGMTEKIRKRIFDLFFTTKPVGKGTGMGLSISYQIVVEKHRGKFECISAPGQGAEFQITIPLQQQP
jgi:PAS domain S-box-containing protein